jgi:hypothetical protein
MPTVLHQLYMARPRLGPYKILEAIRGRMGEVYLVLDPMPGREVAIKFRRKRLTSACRACHVIYNRSEKGRSPAEVPRLSIPYTFEVDARTMPLEAGT